MLKIIGQTAYIPFGRAYISLFHAKLEYSSNLLANHEIATYRYLYVTFHANLEISYLSLAKAYFHANNRHIYELQSKPLYRAGIS
jgi:hypothetical protein